MILYRKKWRWDAAAIQFVINWYWQILSDRRNSDKFPTLVAFDADTALKLADREGAKISAVRDVDNLEELKKNIKKEYELKLANET